MSENEIIKKLQELKNQPVGGQADEAWLLRTREILLSQIGSNNTVKDSSATRLTVYKYFFQEVLLSQKVVRPTLGLAGIILMVGGVNLVSSASASSLPGDWLYPVKITTEKIQVSLASQEEKKVQLKLNSVSKRVDELNKIAAKPATAQTKKDNMEIGTKQLTQDVKGVEQSLDKISKNSSPVVAANVAKTVDTKTIATEKAVIQIAQQLPEAVQQEVKPVLKEALTATDSANTKALAVVVEKHQTGQAGTTNQEVAQLVSEKIKTTQEKVEAVAQQVVALGATSTPMVVSLSNSPTSTPSSTTLVQLPKVAEKTLNAAEKAVSQENFTEAITKITESKQIIDNISNKVPEAVPVVPLATTTATSTAPTEEAKPATATASPAVK